MFLFFNSNGSLTSYRRAHKAYFVFYKFHLGKFTKNIFLALAKSLAGLLYQHWHPFIPYGRV